VVLPRSISVVLLSLLFLMPSMMLAQAGDVFSAGNTGSSGPGPVGPGTWIALGPRYAHGANGPYVWQPRCDEPRDHWLYGVVAYSAPTGIATSPPTSIRDPKVRQNYQIYARQQQAILGRYCRVSPTDPNRGGKGSTWTCTATCTLQGIGGNAPPVSYVTGQGSGNSENEACVKAKRDATQKAPRGTYPRHCKCECAKR